MTRSDRKLIKPSPYRGRIRRREPRPEGSHGDLASCGPSFEHGGEPLGMARDGIEAPIHIFRNRALLFECRRREV